MSVLDLTSQAEREAYLAGACHHDADLRESVERLLAAHERADHVLDQPIPQSPELREHFEDIVTVLNASTETEEDDEFNREGELVGNFRMMEKIGEGTFGEIYVAQQEQPFRRRVAIKLLKLGMNTKEVLARFDAERQALAMMTHPNIAQVFDAGTTASGQSYFAMELVRGLPITEFCDGQQLDITERIELYIDVCHAVQHAHLKGVIHRDLKPSNVLVTVNDGKPVAKVIDFGVAKAIGEPLTNQTIYTRFMQLIGTPMYMSPEQAEMNSLDIDTRCDVFSLGMMLYELLTGATPYDKKRLGSVPFDELRRIIREEELPLPSYRLSTLGKAELTAQSRRKNSLKQLIVALRGDLEWIVMKAVEKDRSRRYETASALAQDLRRYLDNEPVEARPPSSLYRFSKFARRHHVMIIAAAMVLMAMILGTGVSLWQMARAVAERDAKELAREDAVRARQEVEEFSQRLGRANVLLTSGRAHADAGRWREASLDYSKAVQTQPRDFHVWIERGAFYTRLGLWKAAADDYVQALKLEPSVSGAEWWGVPQLMLLSGNESAYADVCQKMWDEAAGSTDASFGWIIRSSLFKAQTSIEPNKLVAAAEQFQRQSRQMPNGNQGNTLGPDPSRRHGGHDEPHEGGFESQKRGQPPNGPRQFGNPLDHRRFGALPTGVGLYILGLAHYRAGHYDQAIDQLRASMTDDPHWRHKSIGYPALAMACFRAGKIEDAKDALNAANQALDEWTSSLLLAELGATPIPWFDYVECILLHREATLLLSGTPPAVNAHWIKLQERAQDAIR